jgi:hypothetical protein
MAAPDEMPQDFSVCEPSMWTALAGKPAVAVRLSIGGISGSFDDTSCSASCQVLTSGSFNTADEPLNMNFRRKLMGRCERRYIIRVSSATRPESSTQHANQFLLAAHGL